MSFFETLKRLFGGGGQDDTGQDDTGRDDSGARDSSGGRDSSTGEGSPGGSAVAVIPCEEAAARLFEYLDGELEDVSEEEVRAHLDVCATCYPRVQFERHFLDALQRSQNGGRVSDDLRARVIQSLAEDDESD